MTTEKPKRIPYGLQNWEGVRLDNCYYVDKTRFIAEIEASNNFFFFIRPRCFGNADVARAREKAIDQITHYA